MAAMVEILSLSAAQAKRPLAAQVATAAMAHQRLVKQVAQALR